MSEVETQSYKAQVVAELHNNDMRVGLVAADATMAISKLYEHGLMIPGLTACKYSRLVDKL
jgi:hypothetical protein